MTFYIGDILDFTQIRINKLRKNVSEFELKETIENSIAILQEQADFKNIKIIEQYGIFNNGQIVKTDQSRLQQVFINILSNAIKFT